jgi:hypothetical protein
MEDIVTGRVEQQVRSAFPGGAIARVQVLQYGDDREVEPGQAAIRVFFDWPGRSDGKKADPKTVHAFVVANSAALDVLRDELPGVIRWVEFRPEPPAGAASPDGLAYRITDRGRRAAAPDDFTPVMTRFGPAGPGDPGQSDHRGHREQPRRGRALGREPPPPAPGGLTLRLSPAELSA